MEEQGGGGDTVAAESPREEQTLPKDVIFDLLSAKRRRDVLAYMAQHGTETTLSDLADHIAATENDTEIRLLDSQQRKRVYIALYQCHLPRMDDADVIDFEHARGTVELRPTAEILYQYMRLCPGDADAAEPDGDESLVSAIRSTVERLATKS